MLYYLTTRKHSYMPYGQVRGEPENNCSNSINDYHINFPTRLFLKNSSHSMGCAIMLSLNPPFNFNLV